MPSCPGDGAHDAEHLGDGPYTQKAREFAAARAFYKALVAEIRESHGDTAR